MVEQGWRKAWKSQVRRLAEKILDKQIKKMKSGNYIFPSTELLDGHEGVRLADSVGIEAANDRQSTIPLKAMLSDEAFLGSKAELPVAMGVDISNKVKVFDLADAPHLLIAGASNQGKGQCHSETAEAGGRDSAVPLH